MNIPKLTKDQWLSELYKARKRNHEMTETEHTNGFAAPSDVGPLELVKVAKEAVRAGFSIGNSNPIFEAVALLELAEISLEQISPQGQ